MSKILILLIVLTTLINLSECKRCRQPKLEGNNCGGTRWWYVAKEKACKPFQFKGCGGNQNNFNSFASCQKACKGH
uniref:BPTI/Kunitz inhibitor domain-containing protein n=1 Tax=Meloidogyne floridensis TaxID=298350 RepID=A0A915P9E8_9BILA